MALSRHAAAVLLSFALVGCDVDFFISPGLVVVGTTDLRLRPISPFPQPIPIATCPSVQPFIARFDIVIATSRIDHDMEEIDVWFSDRRGTSGRTTTLDRSHIARDFGSTTIIGGQSRVLPFSHGFGCGTLTSGTLVVVVRLRDANGGGHTVRNELAIDGM